MCVHVYIYIYIYIYIDRYIGIPALLRSLLIRLPDRLQRREGIRPRGFRGEECAVLLEHIPEGLRHSRNLPRVGWA